MRPVLRHSAFTLAEVMVVVTIIGVLSTLAMAAVMTISGRARLQRDADGVEELVRKARNVARNARRCVRVDATLSRLTLVPQVHPRGAPPDCSGGTDDSVGRQTLALGPGVRLAPASFFFDRSGGAVGGPQDILVTVTAPGLPPRTFTVRAFVGAGAVVRRG